MQPLAAQSPSPARAPGKEAGNAERAVNLVRTFPGLHEVAADLASQPPLAARSPSPEMQAPPAPPLAARSPSPATRPPPAPPASPERPPMGGVSVVASGHAMPAAGPPLPSQGEVNRRAKIAAHYARSKADLINARSKAKRAVAEATCKGMLGTELGSVAQQPPQAPTATNDQSDPLPPGRRRRATRVPARRGRRAGGCPSSQWGSRCAPPGGGARSACPAAAATTGRSSSWPRLLLRARVLCVSCVCLVCKIFRLDRLSERLSDTCTPSEKGAGCV